LQDLGEKKLVLVCRIRTVSKAAVDQKKKGSSQKLGVKNNSKK
jgi:hypothetical protein